MDGQRFDTLALTLSTVSRRAWIRIVVGAGLGALLAQAGRQEAAARCRKPGRKCSRGEKCCGGAKCKGRKCKCPAGQIGAGRRCVTGQGTCAADADACAGTAGACNGNPECACYQTVGGDTRCGTFAGSCGACANDGDCAEHGAGAFCITTTPACCHPANGVTICGVPCPA